LVNAELAEVEEIDWNSIDSMAVKFKDGYDLI
jgi:hypothetical protein